MMKNTILYITLGVLAMLIQSCGPTPPALEEIESRIQGTYCDESGNYRLEIKTDGNYFNRKVEIGPLGVGNQRDVCLGEYTLELKNEVEWVLSFSKDDRPAASPQSCEKSFVVWSPEKGYTMGDQEPGGKVAMEDLFDGKELIKDACED